MQPIQKDFIADSMPVIKLLEKDDFEGAYELFNETMYEKWKDLMCTEPLLAKYETFFFILDEYLNNTVARDIGLADKDKVISDFYEDVLGTK